MATQRIGVFWKGGLAVVVLVCFASAMSARAGTVAGRPISFPVTVSLPLDHATDSEGAAEAWSVQGSSVVGLRPPAPVWMRDGVQAVLDALQSLRRSSITRISLPPPARG